MKEIMSYEKISNYARNDDFESFMDELDVGSNEILARTLGRTYSLLRQNMREIKKFIDELEHNKNINSRKKIDNRVDIDYVIERLNDILNRK